MASPLLDDGVGPGACAVAVTDTILGKGLTGGASVAVAICTRNRPFELGRTLSSVIRSGEGPEEVIVVDQSSDRKSAHVTERYRGLLPALRYIRDERVGSSAAHNLACASTSCGVIVFTDDDCEVTPGWMTALSNRLLAAPRSGIAFGEVRPAQHDTALGFIVGYRPTASRELKGRLAKLRDGGIGANMAVKTEAVRKIGGFDEYLGPGGQFHACLDGDIAYRMLANGFSLLHVPSSVVLHHGFREMATSGPSVRRTYTGIGASYFKYVRCGDMAGLLLLGHQVGLVSFDIGKHLLRRRRPIGLGKLWGLLRGVRLSFGRSVDRKSLRYV